MTLALSVIILLAVGSDYNLLVVSRFKEEIGAGINSHESAGPATCPCGSGSEQALPPRVEA